MDEISRRRFLTQAGLSAAGLAAAGVLAGCGSKSKPSTSSSGSGSKSMSAAAKSSVLPAAYAGDLPKTTLHLAIEAGPEADAHTALAADFKKFTKGRVTVEVEQQSRTGYNQKYLTLMQAKSSEWDVISYTNNNFGLYAPRGYLLPFTNYMANKDLFNAAAFDIADYAPAVKSAITYKGDLYGFVQTVSASMLYYRKDLLKKYGGVTAPPAEGWSLDEVTAISKKMLPAMKADGLKTYPFFYMAGPDQASATLYEFAEFSNVPVLSAGLKPQFSNPKIAEVIDWTISMQQQGLVPPGLGEDSYAQGTTILQNEQAAMGIQWDAAAATILDPKMSPKIYNKIGFGRVPYSPTGGPQAHRQYPSVWAMGVSSFSKNPEAAFAYCTWFCSPDVGKTYITNGGGTTGRKSLLSSPEVLAKAPWYKELGETLALLGSLPFTPAFPYIMETLMLQTGTKIWAGGQTPASIKSDLASLDSAILTYLHQQGIKVS